MLASMSRSHSRWRQRPVRTADGASLPQIHPKNIRKTSAPLPDHALSPRTRQLYVQMRPPTRRLSVRAQTFALGRVCTVGPRPCEADDIEGAALRHCKAPSRLGDDETRSLRSVCRRESLLTRSKPQRSKRSPRSDHLRGSTPKLSFNCTNNNLNPKTPTRCDIAAQEPVLVKILHV